MFTFQTFKLDGVTFSIHNDRPNMLSNSIVLILNPPHLGHLVNNLFVEGYGAIHMV